MVEEVLTHHICEMYLNLYHVYEMYLMVKQILTDRISSLHIIGGRGPIASYVPDVHIINAIKLRPNKCPKNKIINS